MHKKPRIKLIDGLHLTATEKRHIANLISNNIDIGHTRVKQFEIKPIQGTTYSVTIRTKCWNDYKRPYIEKKRVTIQTI